VTTKYVVPLMLILSYGCGAAPAYEISGLSVFFDDVPEISKHKIEKMINQTFDAWFQVKGTHAENVFYETSYELIFKNHEIKCSLDPTDTCFGITVIDERIKIYMADYKCPADSALDHEIFHVIKNELEGKPERHHKDSEIWMDSPDTRDYLDTAEGRLYYSGLEDKELCED
jgi:hypothetical protein